MTAEAQYGRVSTDHQSPKNTEWTIFCGQCAREGDLIYRANGHQNRESGRGCHPGAVPDNVVTNGQWMPSESSDFDIMEIITFRRVLNSDEVDLVIDYMEEKLASTF